MKQFTKQLKYFLSGVITATIFAFLITNALATNGNKTLTAGYSDIKIYIDGTLISPKDATGKAVEPFIIDGTTYLPVRAVGEAFGKEVSWDGATSSVYVGKKAVTPSPTPTASPSNTNYPEAKYIYGNFSTILYNPVRTTIPGVNGNLDAITTYAFEKEYEDAYFLHRNPEDSHFANPNYYISVEAIYDMFPQIEEGFNKKLSRTTVLTYNGNLFVEYNVFLNYMSNSDIPFYHNISVYIPDKVLIYNYNYDSSLAPQLVS
jgi:hypothetical protein